MTRTVVHFCESVEFGGAEQALLHLLAGLDRGRWRPVLMHHAAPGIAPLLAGAREAGVETRAVPDMRSVRQLGAVPAFVREVRRVGPAVFHAHLTWPLACRFGLLGAAAVGVPAVVATVQLFTDPTRSHLGAVQHRAVAAAVDRYLAVSHAVAADLVRVGVPPAKVRVVRNAVVGDGADARPDPALRAWLVGERRDAPVVLTVARLDAQKGHDALLAAAARVPDAVFVLAGDGALRASLERQAQELGVADRVRFLGQRRDVPALLATADLFVLPSHYEGLPLAVLEALAVGTPVVATAVDGTVEAVTHEETGLLVPPGDPAALAAAVRRALGDRELAARLAAAGRARARREFRVDAMVAQTEAAYEEVLAARERGRVGAA